uniref:Ribosomal protein L16 n=1 Tax=Periphykon beckeri TaxID=2006982 RepID=UPI0022FDA5C0|nr:Ribosomal protein L16 [Periphykon beckeri]WAX04134.1 Ribosomal protein L16 [Periphykon beckeri]
MKKKLILRKTHFLFKPKLTKKKHMLTTTNFVGFKLMKTVCFTSKEEDYLKLTILKIFKKLTLIYRPKIFFYFHKIYSHTKLPLEARMGKGKGEITNNFGYYQKGIILFSITKLTLLEAYKFQIYFNKKNILKVKITK